MLKYNSSISFALIVALIVGLIVLWMAWTDGCRVGEAAVPGPITKHLKCDHCPTWFSSMSALRRHERNFHQQTLVPMSSQASSSDFSAFAAPNCLLVSENESEHDENGSDSSDDDLTACAGRDCKFPA